MLISGTPTCRTPNSGGASLQDAKLGGASLQDAVLANANVKNANLRVRPNGLTQEQLDMAIGDYRTQLPDGLSRPAHWAKAEAPETPPAAQPNAAERAPAPSGASGSDK